MTQYKVINGWLAVHVGVCTCGVTGHPYHEPLCGWENLRPVEDLLADLARLERLETAS